MPPSIVPAGGAVKHRLKPRARAERLTGTMKARRRAPACWEVPWEEAERQGAFREDCITLDEVLQAQLDPEVGPDDPEAFEAERLAGTDWAPSA